MMKILCYIDPEEAHSKSENPAKGADEDRATNRRILWATIVIAIAALAQAIAMTLQWCIYRRQVSHYARIERAYISVSVEVTEDELQRAATDASFPPVARILIKITNSGKTPAILYKVQVDIEKRAAWPTKETIAGLDSEVSSGTLIGTYESRPVYIQYPIDTAEWEEIGRDEAQLICYGCVEYRDIFDKVHETGFCWETNPLEIAPMTPVTNMFVMSNNQDLNYYT